MKSFHLLLVLLLSAPVCAAPPDPPKKMTEAEIKEFRRGFTEGFREAQAQHRAIVEKIVKHRQEAGALIKKGDYAGAEAEFRKALEVAVKELGDDHGESHATRYFLSAHLFDAGKDEEYAQIVARLADFWKRNGGVDKLLSSGFVTKLRNCGDLDLPPRRHEALLQQLATYASALGGTHELAIHSARGRFHTKQKEWEKAAQAYRTGLAQFEKTSRGMSMASIIPRYELALVLVRAGQLAEAERESTAIVRWSTEIFGPDHVFTGSATGSHGVVLASLGRHAEAVPALETGFKTSERIGTKDEAMSVDGLLAYAQSLRQLGRIEDAEKAMARARERILGFKGRKTWKHLEDEEVIRRWNEPKAPSR